MIELLDELINCFSVVLKDMSPPKVEILPPRSIEDDEAELMPINPGVMVPSKLDYLNEPNYDEVPF